MCKPNLLIISYISIIRSHHNVFLWNILNWNAIPSLLGQDIDFFVSLSLISVIWFQVQG